MTKTSRGNLAPPNRSETEICGYSSFINLRVFKLILVGLITLSFLFNALTYSKQLTNILAGYGDFVIFYSSARIISDGKGGHLYDLALQTRYHRELGFVDRGGILPFNHPAYQLLPLLPLAYFPYQLAYVIWTILNILLLVLICKLLLPLLPSENRIIPIAALIAFSPTMLALLNGQDSIVSAFLLSAALVNFKRNRDALGGMCLGLGLYKPQLVLPFAVVLAYKQRWVSLRAFIVTGIAAALISCAMIGWNGVLEYVGFISWMNRIHYTIYPEHMANIRGLVETVFSLQQSNALTNLVVLGLSIPLYAWCLNVWKGPWEPTHATFELQVAHLLATTLLISYHLYPYDLTLFGLALVLVLAYVLAGSVVTRFGRLSLLTVLMAFFVPLGLHLINEAGQVPWVSLLIFVFAALVAKEIADRRLTVH